MLVGCHGEKGAGNGPDAGQLRVRAAVLSSAAVQEQSDGALWWKISLGRQPMPRYGFRLSMADRWNLINYIRTLRSERLVLLPERVSGFEMHDDALNARVTRNHHSLYFVADPMTFENSRRRINFDVKLYERADAAFSAGHFY